MGLNNKVWPDLAWEEGRTKEGVCTTLYWKVLP